MMFWVWFAIAICAIVLELVTPTALVCIWFAIGAGCAYLVTWFHVSFWIQLIVFFVISLFCFTITRPLSKKLMRGNQVATNADRVINQKAIVLKEIGEHQWGSVKVLGNEWHAISVDKEVIAKDSIVRVIAIDGAKLIVKKI